MLPAIRAELRKLLTVRSTYIITGLSLLLIGFIAFWGMGYKSATNYIAQSPDLYQNSILNAISIVQIFSGIVAILIVTHEYRYNTIMHTLTITNRRIKVLLAKVAVIAAYSLVFTVVALGLVALLIYLGVKMDGQQLIGQHVDLYSVIWRSLFFVASGTLAAMVFGFLSRSTVFAIVTFFIIPTTVEPLLNNLLKINANYLPFMAQNQILSTGMPHAYSPLGSAGVFAAYVVGAWILAAVLFVRRDAN